MDRELLITRLKEMKPNLMGEYGFSKLALFGSYARNEQNDESDIDLVIWSDSKNYFKLIELKHRISREFNCSVDLGYYDSIKTFIKDSISSEMIYV